jgi:hypothetical protein
MRRIPTPPPPASDVDDSGNESDEGENTGTETEQEWDVDEHVAQGIEGLALAIGVPEDDGLGFDDEGIMD